MPTGWGSLMLPCWGEEQATLVCPWQFQELLRPAAQVVPQDGKIGRTICFSSVHFARWKWYKKRCNWGKPRLSSFFFCFQLWSGGRRETLLHIIGWLHLKSLSSVDFVGMFVVLNTWKNLSSVSFLLGTAVVCFFFHGVQLCSLWLTTGVPAMLAIGSVTQLRYNIDSLFKPDPVDFDSSCCVLMIHIYICDVCRLYLIINDQQKKRFIVWQTSKEFATFEFKTTDACHSIWT